MKTTEKGAAPAPQPTQHIIHRSDDRPIRFEGSVIGLGRVQSDNQDAFYTRVRLLRTKSGSYVWAWDRSLELEPKSPGDLERADARVVKRETLHLDKDATFAESVWLNRPQMNAKLADAATQAWLEAGGQDGLLALYLHEDVD